MFLCLRLSFIFGNKKKFNKPCCQVSPHSQSLILPKEKKRRQAGPPLTKKKTKMERSNATIKETQCGENTHTHTYSNPILAIPHQLAWLLNDTSRSGYSSKLFRKYLRIFELVVTLKSSFERTQEKKNKIYIFFRQYAIMKEYPLKKFAKYLRKNFPTEVCLKATS